jgi:hypothetical protein
LDFSSLLSNTLISSGLEKLFGIAFVFTVETGFIPISLTKHFDSINSNIQLAKMINSLPLNSFWNQNNNIFTSQLVMSNQLCHLTGVPNGDSLIITLSHSNVSKCFLLENNNCNSEISIFSNLSIQFKNVVSFPIKCAILENTVGQYPCLYGIPEELIIIIITKLDPSDLYVLMRCCKKMYNLVVNNNSLWKKLVNEELKKVTNIQRNQIEHTITDWRNYYFELKRERSGRKKITIIRL